MAAMDVWNDSGGWLVLWLEPLGEDRWLRPGERVRVRSDYLGDDPAFAVTYWASADDQAAGIENIDVWVENANPYAEVTDADGTVVECGYQRPAEIHRKWAAAQAAMEERAAAKKNSHRHAGGEPDEVVAG